MRPSRGSAIGVLTAAYAISLLCSCGGFYRGMLEEKRKLLNLVFFGAERPASLPAGRTACPLPPTSGPVTAILSYGDRIIVGGSFTRVGGVSYAALLDPVNGDTAEGVVQPRCDGPVRASVGDGEGGWFIGGDFTSVNGEPRRGLARINGDGSLHPWTARLNGKISDLSLIEGGLVVCGELLSEDRRGYGVAAVTDEGESFEIYRSPFMETRRAVIIGERMFVIARDRATGETGRLIGVEFTGKTERRYAIDGEVAAIAAEGNTVYVGGSFTRIEGLDRKGAAALDVITGNVTEWNPSVAGSVSAIAPSGDTVYLAGNFRSVGGRERTNLAAVDAVRGALRPWRPVMDGEVRAIAVAEARVFIGGGFRRIGGREVAGSAVIDAATGSAGQWGRFAPVSFETISIGKRAAFVGGSFLVAGGIARRNLMAVNTRTGEVTSWHPDLNGPVRALAVGNGAIYVGGSFSRAGGEARSNLAAFDPESGCVLPWDPDVNGEVRAVAYEDGMIYVGGSFSEVNRGRVVRGCLASFNGRGEVTEWDPRPDGPVHCLLAAEGIIYAGGHFSSLRGGALSRRNIAAIREDGTVAEDWEGSADGPVHCLMRDGGRIYAGGWFGSIDSTASLKKSNLAAFDVEKGTLLGWETSAVLPVAALARAGRRLFLGTARPGEEAFNAPVASWMPPHVADGMCEETLPIVLQGVAAIVADGSVLYVGGDFTRINGVVWPNCAAIDAATGEVIQK